MKNRNVSIAVLSTFIVFLSLLPIQGHAYVPVLTFEDLNALPGGTNPGGETGIDPLPQNYGALTWTSSIGTPYWIHKDTMPGSGYERGTIGYTSIFTSSPLSISGRFDLQGLFITSAWLTSESVHIFGDSRSNLDVDVTVMVNNQTPTWVNLNAIDMSYLVFEPLGGVDGHIVLDNFNAPLNPVPVPPTVWLLGSGLIGLVGLRRKLRNYLKN